MSEVVLIGLECETILWMGATVWRMAQSSSRWPHVCVKSGWNRPTSPILWFMEQLNWTIGIMLWKRSIKGGVWYGYNVQSQMNIRSTSFRTERYSQSTTNLRKSCLYIFIILERHGSNIIVTWMEKTVWYGGHCLHRPHVFKSWRICRNNPVIRTN